MSAHPKRPPADLAAIDLRRPDNAPLVLIDKLRLIESLIGADPEARVVVVTAQPEVALEIEHHGARLRRYLATPDYAMQLGVGIGKGRADAGAEGSLHEVEWRHIQRVLALNKGNKAATARALNIHLSTLKRKLARPPRTA
jgi:ActR/RegA family two-component response regulator